MKSKSIWLRDPEDHDFPAAQDYLELHHTVEDAATIVEALKKAETTKKKAKDILRASRLPLLPKKNIHVKSNIRKVKRGEKLSPVLLSRGDALLKGCSNDLLIADGYHRVCAIYYLSEDLEVPCRLV